MPKHKTSGLQGNRWHVWKTHSADGVRVDHPLRAVLEPICGQVVQAGQERDAAGPSLAGRHSTVLIALPVFTPRLSVGHEEVQGGAVVLVRRAAGSGVLDAT